MASESREAELLAAWEAAQAEWQADVFNAEKQKAVEQAAWALSRERSRSTPPVETLRLKPGEQPPPGYNGIVEWPDEDDDEPEDDDEGDE